MHTTILQDIETKIKNVNGPDMIWTRGLPGIGKSTLAASIANWLLDQQCHVISFQFNCMESTITTSTLWCTVACDPARMFPSLQQHLSQGNQECSLSNIDWLFKLLIEKLLSTLVDAVLWKELLVMMINALNECGGLKHNASGKEDFWNLLHMLKRWIQVDHLKKLKLVITSWLEHSITFPDSISIHDIPSGHGVKLEDSVSSDTHIFL